MTVNEKWVYGTVPPSPQKQSEVENFNPKGTTKTMATNNTKTETMAEQFEDSERYFWFNMVRLLLVAVVIIIIALIINNTISNVISGGEWIPLKNCFATEVSQGHQNYTCWLPIKK